MKTAEPSPARSRWRASLAVLPGAGLALLPKVACPACWPAYAGVLSSLGIGFLIDTAWLLPLTAVFLGLAVGALALRAWRRKGYGPFAVGVAASVAVLLGKFVLDTDPIMVAGIALLVGASFWSSWPIKPRPKANGPACTQLGADACIRESPS